MEETHAPEHGTDTQTNWLTQQRLARRNLIKGGLFLGAAAAGLPSSRLSVAQDATDSYYGYEIEPAEQEGGQIFSAIGSVLRNWSLATGGWPGMSETLVEVNPPNIGTGAAARRVLGELGG